MNDIQSYTTLKLELPRVAWYLGNILSAILGRTITCKAQAEDDSYWSISADDDRFSNSEVVELVHYVGGDMTMIRHCIVPDANSSRSLDMDLCQALLKHVLKLDWEREFVTKDALWILGNWPVLPQFPELEDNTVFVDSRMIDCCELTPMAEFEEALFSEGGTFTDLTKLCEENEAKFGTPLYWMHPYTDGLHNGCYFVLVREGVLVLPYDKIDCEDHEIFEQDSVHLCAPDEMRAFARDFNVQTAEHQNVLSSLLLFLERKEDNRYE